MNKKLEVIKKKPRGRPFVKGNNGGGRNALTDNEKAIAKLTRTQLKIIIRKYLQLNMIRK